MNRLALRARGSLPGSPFLTCAFGEGRKSFHIKVAPDPTQNCGLDFCQIVAFRIAANALVACIAAADARRFPARDQTIFISPPQAPQTSPPASMCRMTVFFPNKLTEHKCDCR